MNKKLELKPCPFCGGKAVFHDCAELENETLNAIYTGKLGVHCTECHTATPPYDGEKAAAEAWNRRKTESVRWIPVTERLPEEGEKVLTYCKFGHMRDRVYRQLGNTMLFTPDGMVPGKDVTHWMPLPDAPKEETPCQTQNT